MAVGVLSASGACAQARPALNQYEAKGILVGALGVLAVRDGYIR